MIYAISALTFLIGLVAGIILHYITEYAPLLKKYDNLVTTMVGMKKQGFVPQFELEQVIPIDVSKEVIEY